MEEQHALRLANLWEGGKMIGGNPLEVLSTLACSLNYRLRNDWDDIISYDDDVMIEECIILLKNKIEEIGI